MHKTNIPNVSVVFSAQCVCPSTPKMFMTKMDVSTPTCRKDTWPFSYLALPNFKCIPCFIQRLSSVNYYLIDKFGTTNVWSNRPMSESFKNVKRSFETHLLMATSPASIKNSHTFISAKNNHNYLLRHIFGKKLKSFCVLFELDQICLC